MSIARYTPILLGFYLAIKLGDLTLRNAWPYIFEGSLQSNMYLIEVLGGVVLPIILLSSSRIRHSVAGLFISASLVIAGVALNRINVFLIAYKPLYAVKPYFPSIFEIAVTIGLICALVLVYRFLVMTFPVIAHPVDINMKQHVPMGAPTSKA